MEEETPKQRNVRPKETSRLPLITLLTLLAIIVALFFIGWEYITDDVNDSEEVTNIVPDTASKFVPYESTIDPELAEPDQIDGNEPLEEALPESPELPPPPPEVETPAVDTKPEPAAIGGTTITHTVRSGETFFGIADRYNLSTETLKSLNPQITNTAADLKAGATKLNVRVQATHTVGAGDVLRVVANKYGISKQLLMQANGKQRDYAERGEKLIIPFAVKK